MGTLRMCARGALLQSSATEDAEARARDGVAIAPVSLLDAGTSLLLLDLRNCTSVFVFNVLCVDSIGACAYAQEPAINRYSTGGCFETHTDKHALTVNILLRAGGENNGDGSSGTAFEGGGTAFFREDVDKTQQLRRQARLRRRPYTFASTVEDAPTVVVHPDAGVGVVFSGEVKHAGRAVTAGLRHLFVASFTIADEPDKQLHLVHAEEGS